MKKSYRLLIYDAIGRRCGRQVMAGFLLLFVIVGIDFIVDWLGGWRYILMSVIPVLILVWLFFMVWTRNAGVHFEKSGLRLQGPLRSFVLPYEQIVAVMPARLSDHFPADQLVYSQLAELEKFYHEPAVFLNLDQEAMPSPLVRRWFSPLLFSKEREGLVLVLDDWVSFARTLDKIRKKVEAPRPVIKKPVFSEIVNVGEVIGKPGNPLVLIADENQGRIKTYERLLAQNYQIVFAHDGPEALRVAREYRPDLIVADHFLDRLDGLQVTASLRRTDQFKWTPIIFLTDAVKPEAFDAGVSDMLVRPFHDGDFLARLANQIKIQEKLARLVQKTEQLETKSLNQMAELVKRGELINFLPEQVARNVLSGHLIDPKSNHQRQKVTVLFVDLVGFTEMTGRLSPNILSALVNEFLREMTAVSLANHGTVDKFIGDEVMVLFGAPEPQSDEVQVAHAAQTAVEMLYAVKQMSLRWKPKVSAGLQVRIAINTGYGTTGIFGDELLRSYTVVGSVVNIAARLRAAAEPGQIVVSSESYALIKNRFQAEPLGQMSLKGVDRPVMAFALAPHIFQETG